MRQTLKNHYATLLWSKVTLKFNNFAKENFDSEKSKKYKLPLTNFDVEITGPLYNFFYKEVTGKDNVPISDSNEIIHKMTFDRHLQKAPNGHADNATLDFYAKFIGYKSFKDFAEKNPTDLETTKKFENRPISAYYLWMVLLITSTVVIVSYLMLKEEKTVEKRLLPFDEEKKVFDFLEASIKAEFKTYQICPKIDTTLLSKYYDKNCEDYWASIFRVLTMHHEKNLTISNHGNKSAYNINDKQIIGLDKDTIVVKTVESWDLLWFKSTTMEYDSAQIRKNTFYNTYKILRKGESFKVVKMKMDSLHRRYDWKKFNQDT